jgi:hypothetical protein
MMSNIDKYVHLFYTPPMKLSQYAKQQGLSYRTALRWFRDGAIKGYKERGWTPALVKKFLDSPDAIKPNPSSRSAVPMPLYSLARVEVREQEDSWKQAAAKATVRSEVGKTVAARYPEYAEECKRQRSTRHEEAS